MSRNIVLEYLVNGRKPIQKCTEPNISVPSVSMSVNQCPWFSEREWHIVLCITVPFTDIFSIAILVSSHFTCISLGLSGSQHSPKMSRNLLECLVTKIYTAQYNHRCVKSVSMSVGH